MIYPERKYRKKIKTGFKPGDMIVFSSDVPHHRNTWILVRRFQDPLEEGEIDNKKKWARRRRWFWVTYNSHKQTEDVHYEKNLRHKLLKYPDLWSLVRK